MAVRIRGSRATKFQGYRTDQQGENYEDIGTVELEEDFLILHSSDWDHYHFLFHRGQLTQDDIMLP